MRQHLFARPGQLHGSDDETFVAIHQLRRLVLRVAGNADDVVGMGLLQLLEGTRDVAEEALVVDVSTWCVVEDDDVTHGVTAVGVLLDLLCGRVAGLGILESALSEFLAEQVAGAGDEDHRRDHHHQYDSALRRDRSSPCVKQNVAFLRVDSSCVCAWFSARTTTWTAGGTAEARRPRPGGSPGSRVAAARGTRRRRPRGRRR
jgi:hypothetical protein